MADLNSLAKRVYNISPDPVRLELDDGTAGVFDFSSVEFFQQEFQGEATRRDDERAQYRVTTSADNESLIVGRQAPGASDWTMVGTVESVERADAE